jgi:hypothetical protein
MSPLAYSAGNRISPPHISFFSVDEPEHFAFVGKATLALLGKHQLPTVLDLEHSTARLY